MTKYFLTRYLVKVGFHCDLQLLQVGGPQLALQFTGKKKEKNVWNERYAASRMNQIDLQRRWRVFHLSAFSFSRHCCSSFRILCFSPLRTLMGTIKFNKKNNPKKIICGAVIDRLDTLTTLPSFFLSTKLRVYSDPCGEKKVYKCLLNVSVVQMTNIFNILYFVIILWWDPTALLSVSLSWRYLPPGGGAWLSFAGCQTSVPGDSAENSARD